MPNDVRANSRDIAPFVQTDFYGDAQAGGGAIHWMPYNRQLFLGGVPDGFNPTFLAGFLELVAVAENLDVARPGHTNLTVHDYQWLGAAGRAHILCL
jgi:hypothetical protein